MTSSFQTTFHTAASHKHFCAQVKCMRTLFRSFKFLHCHTHFKIRMFEVRAYSLKHCYQASTVHSSLDKIAFAEIKNCSYEFMPLRNCCYSFFIPPSQLLDMHTDDSQIKFMIPTNKKSMVQFRRYQLFNDMTNGSLVSRIWEFFDDNLW